MGIKFTPRSTLSFVMAVSLIVYFYGIYADNEDLVNAALPILMIFGVIWGAFISLTIVRNIKKL